MAVAPPEGVPSVRALLGGGAGLSFEGQPAGSLGERLEALCRRAAAGGCGRVVLLGSDSPTLPSSAIDEALQRLLEEDVVIGPSVDGGYYLIGLRAAALPAAAPAGLSRHRLGYGPRPGADPVGPARGGCACR